MAQATGPWLTNLITWRVTFEVPRAGPSFTCRSGQSAPVPDHAPATAAVGPVAAVERI